LQHPLRRTQQPQWLQAAQRRSYDPIYGRVWRRAKLDTKPLAYQPQYRQRLTLHRPTQVELEWLATLPDTMLTRVDAALDHTFGDACELLTAQDTVDRCLIMKWHRHHIWQEDNTRYWAGPRARNVLLRYADRPCRVTGEEFCLHLEWRMMKADAVRQAGFMSVQDVIDADWQRFWEKRLLLCEVDVVKFGQQGNAQQRGHRGRHPRRVQHCNGFDYDVDRAAGAILIQTARVNRRTPIVNGKRRQVVDDAVVSTQRVLDVYRSRFRSRKWLVNVDVKHLLPESRSTVGNSRSFRCVPKGCEGNSRFRYIDHRAGADRHSRNRTVTT
jgi:hypothetical protein